MSSSLLLSIGPLMAAACLLAQTAGAAAAAVSDGTNLVRKEIAKHSFAVDLSADGQVQSVQKATETFDDCNIDFPLGKYNTSGCFGTDEEIFEKGTCLIAANRSGATVTYSAETPEHNFVIGPSWRNKHPRGCFMYDCDEGEGVSDRICYWFNEDDTLYEGNLAGRPVCQRPKYLNSTARTEHEMAHVPNQEEACPHGYKPLEDENECLAVSTCLGFCKGDNFQIGTNNLADYDKYPRGCFVSDFNHPADANDGLPEYIADGCVYFNPTNLNNPPATPRGTRICVVKETVQWPGSNPSLKPAAGGGGAAL